MSSACPTLPANDIEAARINHPMKKVPARRRSASAAAPPTGDRSGAYWSCRLMHRAYGRRRCASCTIYRLAGTTQLIEPRGRGRSCHTIGLRVRAIAQQLDFSTPLRDILPRDGCSSGWLG